MPAISVVIIALNEEKNIGRCLQSVQPIADEIIVVDSGSTDNTASISKKNGAKVLQHPFKDFADQKNFANSKASHDHILSIDADEALSEELTRSVKNIKTGWQFDAYQIKRLTNYCGKWIRHCGWYPDPKIRIFNRRAARWEGKGIHEELVLQPGVTFGKLKGDLLHYSFSSIEQHMNTINRFSSLAAKDMFERGKKVPALKKFLKPISTFLRMYIFRLGFLDGFHGFVICVNSAHSSFLKMVKLHNLYHQYKKSHEQPEKP
ncbi:MAG: glycosyltransferase family 2 protein [Bacteroidales bacterium]|nr:glycosyltransferase family 2 protein [Bacteroidales bacterium]